MSCACGHSQRDHATGPCSNRRARYDAAANEVVTDVCQCKAFDADAPVVKAKRLNQQNKAELLATAAERRLEVPEGATVAQFREALAPAGFAAAEEEPETEPASAEHDTAPAWSLDDEEESGGTGD